MMEEEGVDVVEWGWERVDGVEEVMGRKMDMVENFGKGG